MAADFDRIISRIIALDRYQLSSREYRYVAQSVASRQGCNMLVFGVGNDSLLWLLANKQGKTIFLENSEGWAKKIKEKLPEIDIRLVKYNTQRRQWREMLDGDPAELKLELPAEVEEKRWDIIFVDGPTGFWDSCPGRMKSIYTASILASGVEGADIIIHDCDRKVELAYCEHFFSDDMLVNAFDRTRHYRTKSVFRWGKH